MGCRFISAPPWISICCPGQPAPPWSLPQAAGESLLQCLEHHLLLLLHWPWCMQGCFSHVVSLLSSCFCAVFLPFLKYVITEVLPALLRGSPLASGGSVLKPAETVSVQHGGSSWCLLAEAATTAAPATKTLPCKPSVILYNSFWWGVYS